MGKGWSIFGGASGFLEIAIINFTSHLVLLYFYFYFSFTTINVQTERFCINCYFSLMFLGYFFLLKFFLIVVYFINSLFKRKRV